jgi:competence protein ComEA
MHRQSQDEVAAAARRRLELLGRELEQAGLRRVDETSAVAEDHGLPAPAAVAPAGRHLRPPRPGSARRLAGWVGGRVPDTLRGRTELTAAPVLLVVALVALAVTGTVFVVVRMDGGSDPVPMRTSSIPSTSPLVTASPATQSARPGAASGATSGATSGAAVTVDVAGKVRRPGVATLPAGSRVVDALRKAGGARAGVDLSALNLARVLVDGEQILVGRGVPAGGIAAGASTSAPDPVGSLVNLNTATSAQLDTLPGVGPVTAQKILDWRSAHGAFSAVDELLEIDGIGEKTLADLAPHVTL